MKKNEFDNQLKITDDLNEIIVVSPIIVSKANISKKKKSSKKIYKTKK